MKFLCFIFVFSLWTEIYSQKYYSYVDPIQNSGYAKIQLRPEFIADSKSDFRDMRLIDSKGVQVPYFVLQTSSGNLADSLKIKLNDYELKYSKLGNDNFIRYWSKYPYLIDEIKFNIGDKSMYYRELMVRYDEKIKRKKISINHYHSELTNQSKILYRLNLKKSEFEIQIYNQDNPSLDIKDIQFYQYPIYIVAYLDSSQRYKLTTGDDELDIPNYDIHLFQSKISETLKIYETSDVRSFAEEKKMNANRFYQQKGFMWVVIGLGAVLIIISSVLIVFQMQKKS